MFTYSGRKFDPSKVETLDVSIRDIAYHLSGNVRYNGSLIFDYKVAQHCLIVDEIVRETIETDPKYHDLTKRQKHDLRLSALLHDAGEAYLPDVPAPLKKDLPEFVALEERVLKHIFNTFNLPFPYNKIIDNIDKSIRYVEMYSMAPTPFNEAIGVDLIKETINNLPDTYPRWIHAITSKSVLVNMFLRRYEEIELLLK